MNHQPYSNGILIDEIEGGLLVQQRGEAYLARNWRLTPSVVQLIRTAIASGLDWMIRSDHPLRKARWPNARGVVYLAFSASPDLQWAVAIDTLRPARGDFGHAVFNGKYHAQFVARGIPFIFEGRNKTSGHLVVAREFVMPTLAELAHFDHSVLALNRTPHQGDGFTTEYVIRHSILANWDQTPLDCEAVSTVGQYLPSRRQMRSFFSQLDIAGLAKRAIKCAMWRAIARWRA